jgi:hypothetical protein
LDQKENSKQTEMANKWNWNWIDSGVQVEVSVLLERKKGVLCDSVAFFVEEASATF